jgi:hypothetical protein
VLWTSRRGGLSAIETLGGRLNHIAPAACLFPASRWCWRATNEGPERIKKSGDRRQGVKDIGATNYADADTLVAA